MRTLADRFWEKVAVRAGCWGWLSSSNQNGYGQIKCREAQRPKLAHRVSWEIHNGEVPVGRCVLHSCDNPPCTNPSHLFLGTRGDNNRDMRNKGRQVTLRGEANPAARLTECDVIAIRASHDSERALAARYHCSKALIGYVRRRKRWRHV